MKKKLLLWLGVALLGIALWAISDYRNFWRSKAEKDIIASYNILKENHPGYYDLENSTWKILLDDSYKASLKKASEVASGSNYRVTLKDFVNAFNDKHLTVTFNCCGNTFDDVERKASIEKLDDNLVWITLPTFAPESASEKLGLQEVIKNIALYQNAKTIIFDMRGNIGGSSVWAEDIVKHLFSDDYVKEQLAKNDRDNNVFIEWRASKDNISYLKSWLNPEMIKAMHMENEVETIQAIIDGMEKAYQQGQPLFKEVVSKNDKDASAQIKNPVTAKIILITDRRCASACLDFIDYLLLLAPVIHIGQPTASDTAYMECRSIELPSKKAQLIFPIKVYRNRARKPHQKYMPSENIPESILKDTQALIEYVKQM